MGIENGSDFHGYDSSTLVPTGNFADDTHVKVEWWLGTYSGTWQVWKNRETQQYVIVTEILPCVAVLLARLEFTKANRLPAAIVQKLKD